MNYKVLPRKLTRPYERDLELIFTMLGEASTSEIERVKNPFAFKEHQKASKEGGKVAKKARTELENRTKMPVISKENYLEEPEKEHRKNYLNQKISHRLLDKPT